MKILLVELAGIGDAVLSTPAMRNLRRCFPDAYIGYLTFPGGAELMRKSPYLDGIHTLEKGMNVFHNLVILSKLQKLNFDILINLYQLYTKGGSLKMALILNYLKAKKKIGRDTDDRGSFYDVKIADSINSQRHDVEYKLDLVRLLGCEVKDRYLEAWFDDSDKQAVEEFLAENTISNSDILIGINPGATRPSRRWDWRNFAALADELSNRYKAKIIITGNKKEHRLAKKISLKMSNSPLDTSGRLSVTQLVALIKRCSLYITNDTAPMHIANALGVPLVAIMGPGSMRTAPYEKENCLVLRSAASCAPCYKFRCRDMCCLNNISVDSVIEASGKLLEIR